jgi:hypothetical protein
VPGASPDSSPAEASLSAAKLIAPAEAAPSHWPMDSELAAVKRATDRLGVPDHPDTDQPVSTEAEARPDDDVALEAEVVVEQEAALEGEDVAEELVVELLQAPIELAEAPVELLEVPVDDAMAEVGTEADADDTAHETVDEAAVDEEDLMGELEPAETSAELADADSAEPAEPPLGADVDVEALLQLPAVSGLLAEIEFEPSSDFASDEIEVEAVTDQTIAAEPEADETFAEVEDTAEADYVADEQVEASSEESVEDAAVSEETLADEVEQAADPAALADEQVEAIAEETVEVDAQAEADAVEVAAVSDETLTVEVAAVPDETLAVEVEAEADFVADEPVAAFADELGEAIAQETVEVAAVSDEPVEAEADADEPVAVKLEAEADFVADELVEAIAEETVEVAAVSDETLTVEVAAVPDENLAVEVEAEADFVADEPVAAFADELVEAIAEETVEVAAVSDEPVEVEAEADEPVAVEVEAEADFVADELVEAIAEETVEVEAEADFVADEPVAAFADELVEAIAEETVEVAAVSDEPVATSTEETFEVAPLTDRVVEAATAGEGALELETAQSEVELEVRVEDHAEAELLGEVDVNWEILAESHVDLVETAEETFLWQTAVASEASPEAVETVDETAAEPVGATEIAEGDDEAAPELPMPTPAFPQRPIVIPPAAASQQFVLPSAVTGGMTADGVPQPHVTASSETRPSEPVAATSPDLSARLLAALAARDGGLASNPLQASMQAAVPPQTRECAYCKLELSAKAKFCRRCGTRQAE